MGLIFSSAVLATPSFRDKIILVDTSEDFTSRLANDAMGSALAALDAVTLLDPVTLSPPLPCYWTPSPLRSHSQIWCRPRETVLRYFSSLRIRPTAQAPCCAGKPSNGRWRARRRRSRRSGVVLLRQSPRYRPSLPLCNNLPKLWLPSRQDLYLVLISNRSGV